MQLDIQNQLSLLQAFTGAATVTTNSYQKQSASQDLSIGRRMSLLWFPKVAAGAGSSWLLEAIQADDAALTVNVASLASITVLAASLLLGFAFEVPFPQGSMTQTYLGGRATGTGGTTTCTFDVHIVPAEEIPFFRSFINVVPVKV